MNIEKFLFDLSSEFQEMQKNGRSCEMIYALEKISVQVLNLALTFRSFCTARGLCQNLLLGASREMTNPGYVD